MLATLCARTPEAPGCSGTTSRTRTRYERREPHGPARVGGRGPDRPGEPDPARPPARPQADGRQARAVELLEAFGLADAAGKLVKQYWRHAPPARHRRASSSLPQVMFLDHHRPRPAPAQPGLGHRPLPGRGGNDDPALHPVPRRGRPARRRNRRDRPRHGDRRGHAGPAQGTAGALHVRLLDPDQRPEAERVLSRELDAVHLEPDPRRRPALAPPPAAPPRRLPSCRAGSRSPTSRWDSRASTRSFWR